MFDHILVPLDGSTLAECVLPHIVKMSPILSSRVTLVHVLKQSYGAGLNVPDPLEWHLRKTRALSYLGGVSERLKAVGLDVSSRLLEGDPAQQIIEFARVQRVDLILLSSHGQGGISGWNISSVVQKIIFRTHLSILIVRAYNPQPEALEGLRYRRLLLPLDGSKRAERILPLATALSRERGSQMLLVHVVQHPTLFQQAHPTKQDLKLTRQLTQRNQQQADRYLSRLKTQLPANGRVHFWVAKDVPVALHQFVVQENVDLVVMSAHGHSAQAHWPFGSIATNAIMYGSVPLLIVQDLTPEEMVPSPAELAQREHKGH